MSAAIRPNSANCKKPTNVPRNGPSSAPAASQWLSTWVEKYVEQDALVAEIEQRGGKVHTEGVDWLRRSFGDDFSVVAEKVQGIELTGPKVDDHTLAWLSSHRGALVSLKSLNLSGSAITDAGLQHVAAFPNLHKLDLSDTAITGAGLYVLQKLGDAGLARLAQCQGRLVRSNQAQMAVPQAASGRVIASWPVSRPTDFTCCLMAALASAPAWLELLRGTRRGSGTAGNQELRPTCRCPMRLFRRRNLLPQR